MGTYLNAYEILSEVRTGLNEYSVAKVNGTDTTGAYRNEDIHKKINDAQKFLFDILINRNPQLFYKKTTLTPSSSIISVPSDFYRMKRLENLDGYKINEVSMDQKTATSLTGSSLFYYWSGGDIYIDSDNFTENVVLYYVFRPREIHSGLSSAGGAKSLTLSSTAKKITDYYNGMLIENVTDDWVDTIDDYSSARVATLLAQTGSASRYYGLVSELPEVFHPFIGRKALISMKNILVSPGKPGVVDFNIFMEDLNETIKSFLGTTNTDQDFGDLFL